MHKFINVFSCTPGFLPQFSTSGSMFSEQFLCTYVKNFYANIVEHHLNYTIFFIAILKGHDIFLSCDAAMNNTSKSLVNDSTKRDAFETLPSSGLYRVNLIVFLSLNLRREKTCNWKNATVIVMWSATHLCDHDQGFSALFSTNTKVCVLRMTTEYKHRKPTATGKPSGETGLHSIQPLSGH